MPSCWVHWSALSWVAHLPGLSEVSPQAACYVLALYVKSTCSCGGRHCDGIVEAGMGLECQWMASRFGLLFAAWVLVFA